MLYVVYSTDRSALRGNTATSCMFSETLAMHFGKLTGTYHHAEVILEKGGIRNDEAAVHGGSALHRGPKDPTLDGTGNGGGARAERGGVRKEHPGLGIAKDAVKVTEAEVQLETGQGVIVVIEADGAVMVGIKLGQNLKKEELEGLDLEAEAETKK